MEQIGWTFLLVFAGLVISVVLWLVLKRTATHMSLPLNDDDDTEFRDRSRVRRKALLVAINAYPRSPLGGCVNDANDIFTKIVSIVWQIPYSKLFFQGTIKRLRVANCEVRVLRDEAATAKNIRAGLRWLYEGTQAGDVRLFSFSGHGSQVDSTTEEDALDEILCPVDLDWDKPDTWLRDDEFSQFTSTVPPGANCILWIDACHSADMLRTFRFERTARYMPAPEQLHRAQGRVRQITSAPAHDSFVALSGCRTDQTSMDATFEDADGNKRKNGAMTYCMIRAFERGATTLRAIHEAGSAMLRELQYEQEPQLEGFEPLRDVELLSSTATKQL